MSKTLESLGVSRVSLVERGPKSAGMCAALALTIVSSLPGAAMAAPDQASSFSTAKAVMSDSLGMNHESMPMRLAIGGGALLNPVGTAGELVVGGTVGGLTGDKELGKLAGGYTSSLALAAVTGPVGGAFLLVGAGVDTYAYVVDKQEADIEANLKARTARLAEVAAQEKTIFALQDRCNQDAWSPERTELNNHYMRGLISDSRSGLSMPETVRRAAETEKLYVGAGGKPHQWYADYLVADAEQIQKRQDIQNEADRYEQEALSQAQKAPAPASLADLISKGVTVEVASEVSSRTKALEGALAAGEQAKPGLADLFVSGNAPSLKSTSKTETVDWDYSQDSPRGP
jgi:hypothetical protein